MKAPEKRSNPEKESNSFPSRVGGSEAQVWECLIYSIRESGGLELGTLGASQMTMQSVQKTLYKQKTTDDL